MRFSDLVKGGPYIGPRGGKWADPQHKIPWQTEKKRSLLSILRDFKFRPKKDKPSAKSRGMLRGLLTKDFGLLISKSNSLSTLMKFRAIFAAHVDEDVRTPKEKKQGTSEPSKRTRDGYQNQDKTKTELSPRQMLALIDRRIAFLEGKKKEQEADKAPVAVDMDTGKVSAPGAQEKPDSDHLHEREDVPEGFPLDKAAFEVLGKMAATRDQEARRQIGIEFPAVVDALESAALAFFTAAKGWLLSDKGREFVDEVADSESESEDNFDTMPDAEPEPVTESEDNFDTMPDVEPVNEPEDTNVDIEVPKNEEPDSDPNVKPRVKFEDVGEILEGSRKQIAELAEMTREQAAKSLTRKKLTKWQGLVKEAGTQAEQGNSPSAAILKDIIISSIAATPFAIGKNDPVTKLVWEKHSNKELEGTTATSNLGELYISGINFVMRTLDKCKTGEDVLTFLNEWSRKSRATKSLGKRQFDSVEDAKEVMGEGDTLVRYLSIPDPRDYNPNRRVLVKYGEGNTAKEMEDSLSSFVVEQTEEQYGKEKLEQAKHIYRIEYAAPSVEDQNYYSTLKFALAGIRLENQYSDKMRSPLYSLLAGNISDDGNYPGYFKSKKIRDAFTLAERFDGKDWDDEDVAQYFGQTIKERKRKSGFRFTREATGEDPRVGGKQIGTTDPERLRTETNMRGVQFGKYVSQKDRGLHVESAHAALSDLSDVLNVPLEDISLSGRLGLAFGARGRGSAAAHYETDQFNINITRKLGGGSLAHEWGHFLDNVMCHAYGLEKPSTQLGTDTVANGRLLSTYAFRGNIPESVPLKVRESFQKVHDAIHKGEPKKPDIQEYKDALEAERKSKREVLALRRKDVNEYNRRVPEHNRLAERRHYLGQFFRSDEKYDHVKEPRPFEQERIDNFMASIPSRFRADCEAMNSSYLANPAEMFARSFEAFVEDELKNNGRRNNYLVMSTQDIQTTGKTSSLTPAGEEAQIYPQGEDRQRINEAMRGLIEALKEDGAFKKGMKSLRDKDLAILIPPPPSEMERVAELSKVSDQYRNRKCPEQMQDVLDSDMDALFNALLIDAGLPSSMYMITGIRRSILPSIRLHKDYFGALRPNVLAERHGIDFEYDYLDSAQTPSYPSGHTTWATYLAKVLGAIYPEMQSKLDKLANQVADSRIDRGVHLPSDNDAGRQLAQALFEKTNKTMLAGDARYTEVFGG